MFKKISDYITNPNHSNFSPLAACLFIAGNLFLYQPAIIYWGNEAFLTYSFSKSMFWLLPLFFISFFLLWLLSVMIGKRLRKYSTPILTGIAFSMWAATLFDANNGILDGVSFDLIHDRTILWSNIIFILLIFGITTVLSFYYARFIKSILFSISAISLIFVCYVIIVQKASPLNNPQQLREKLTTFSKKKNVLVILLDTFEGGFFQEILDNNPSFAQEFPGFIYFPKAMGVAPTTYLSVPTIHSGELYQQGQTVNALYKQALKNSFLTAHANSGYEALLLNPFMGHCTKEVSCGNEIELYFREKAAFSESILLINLSIFKSIPHFIKPYIYNNGYWNLGNDFSPSRAMLTFNTLSIIASSMNTKSAVPTIKFIHLFGSHAPSQTTATCEFNKSNSWNRQTAINQDTCVMSQVIKAINALKEQNIYDQTAIMIIGDHGASLSPSNGFIMGSAANPLFLYKPFQASKALETSNKFVSLIDIAATLCAATKACHQTSYNGYDVLSHSTNQSRKFIFNYYSGSKHTLIPHLPHYITPFSVNGDPSQIASWHRLFPKSLPVRNEIVFSDSSFEDYYGTGWSKSKPELTFRWAHSPQAEIFLPLAPSKNAHIQFSAITHSLNPQQYITVLANNVYMGKFAVDYLKDTVIHLDISGAHITKEPTHLVFQFDQLNNPPGSNTGPLAVRFLNKLIITSSSK